MRVLLVAAAGIGLSIAAAVFFARQEPPLYAACEDALQSYLRAPASYQRLAISVRAEPITGEDLVIRIPIRASREDRKAIEAINRHYRAAGPMTRFVLTIDYDAANAYGTPMRGRAICSKHARGRVTVDEFEPGPVRPDIRLL